MKYKLIKKFPGIQFNVGDIYEFDYYTPEKYPDFFEPILEKKTYDDLKGEESIFQINWNGNIVDEYFSTEDARSQVFLTREEAEDENKRREWAVRKDKFVPKRYEDYYYPDCGGDICFEENCNASYDILLINSGLAFRTREDCQDAIDNQDLIRLFYQIR